MIWEQRYYWRIDNWQRKLTGIGMETVLLLICLRRSIMDCNWTETGSPLCVSYDDSL